MAPPDTMHWLFWDVDLEELEVERHAEYILSRVLDRGRIDDVGWARYPEVMAGTPSKPPLGGINIGVSAYSKHTDLAVDAAKCITSKDHQKEYMVSAKNPAARSDVYDDPEVRQVFPMADLIRESIDGSGSRPQTPYYTDVSTAVVRTFHPPASVDPNQTPKNASTLIVDVLHDRKLL